MIFILTTWLTNSHMQLMHKVRSGQRVEDAVEDIISKGVSELRKNAFGEDAEDAKNLAWTREQAWAIMKQLSKEEEVEIKTSLKCVHRTYVSLKIPYHETVINFPFKGDEVSLRNMEHAELITIGTKDGKAQTIFCCSASDCDCIQAVRPISSRVGLCIDMFSND